MHALGEVIPDARVPPFDHAFSRAGSARTMAIEELANHEGLEEFHRDVLGQSAFVQVQVQAHTYDAAPGVIDAFAQQIAPEAALLPFERLRQTFEWVSACSSQWAFSTRIVKESIAGLLQQLFLIVQDHVGSAAFQKFLDPSIAMKDPFIERIQIGGGQTPSSHTDERPQVGRQHRDDIQDGPGGLDPRTAKRLHDLQSPDRFLLVVALLAKHLAEGCRKHVEVQRIETLANRLRPGLGMETVANEKREFAIALLIKERARRQ